MDNFKWLYITPTVRIAVWYGLNHEGRRCADNSKHWDLPKNARGQLK